jgi:hypothetical protein
MVGWEYIYADKHTKVVCARVGRGGTVESEREGWTIKNRETENKNGKPRRERKKKTLPKLSPVVPCQAETRTSKLRQNFASLRLSRRFPPQASWLVGKSSLS